MALMMGITSPKIQKILKEFTQEALDKLGPKALNILEDAKNGVIKESEAISKLNKLSEGFKNFSDLSLKTLARLEGKTTVSKQIS